jgi:hypothetical protein
MNVCWVLSQDIPAGFVKHEVLTSVGPIWGPLSKWREYQSDNTVCYDLREAKQMISRAFHAVTHFYVPKEQYIELGRPVGVRLFEGEFKDSVVANKEDIILMNLVASTHDIVLMLGFDLTPVESMEDKIHERKLKAYRHNIKTIIAENSTTQFVLVNYGKKTKLAKNFSEVENLTRDTVESVVDLLI